MPRRNDLKRILILGSGPIVIGQACEFDYSGTQAARALKESGFEVILVNSNPATIMTDPDYADATYIEPLSLQSVRQIIAREKPDAILATMGGQVALNLARALHMQGEKTPLIGANISAIEKAEDRAIFKALVEDLGLSMPRSMIIRHQDELETVFNHLSLPLIVRPSYTLGGLAGGIAEDRATLFNMCQQALKAAKNASVELSESLLGYKEFELEVIRDKADNAIVICSIENINPMGVHTGDSITVAPQQTLTDKEYQLMRDSAFKIIRAVGVETGGANVQFAVNPKTGKQYVIEMNPRVSRSSALASKATGFPIAKIAAKLAVGYTLDELKNDMTGTTASFEPTLDYVITKIPYFQFNKFKGSQDALGTQMHSIGEVMAVGGTFIESFEKALKSLEVNFDFDDLDVSLVDTLNSKTIFATLAALKRGLSISDLHNRTQIDPWFLHQWQSMLARKKETTASVYKHIDSCAAEFPVITDYLYSTEYGTECELNVDQRKKIMVIGSSANRIGQGIEFDYSCVQALQAAKALGYQTLMLNCNPETVSTDYDQANKLFFEPVTSEYVLKVIHAEKPDQVLLQFGGQTPINLLDELVQGGAPVYPNLQRVITLTEDREAFNQLLDSLQLNYAAYQTVHTLEEAREFAKVHGYPLLIRPSYVIGGSGIQRINDDTTLIDYFKKLKKPVPLQIEIYLENAIEVDVDLISDGKQVLIGGIVEHVDPAGIHSGDSIQVIPPYTLSQSTQNHIAEISKRLALSLGIVGPLNIQLAVMAQRIYVLELNPRCSRSLPFVAKSTGIPFAKIATRCLLNISLAEQSFDQLTVPSAYAVKIPIFVFHRFTNVDPRLGPEMQSTGEVMGLGSSLLESANKAFEAACWPTIINRILLNLNSDIDWSKLENLIKNYSVNFYQPQEKLELNQFDLIIDTKQDDPTLIKRALSKDVCYISSLRVASLYLQSIQTKIKTLASLQEWQKEVKNYATGTDDKIWCKSTTRNIGSTEES